MDMKGDDYLKEAESGSRFQHTSSYFQHDVRLLLPSVAAACKMWWIFHMSEEKHNLLLQQIKIAYTKQT